jgi:hypothetical protein
MKIEALPDSDHFFLAISKKQAEAVAERLKLQGKIATITPKSGGIYHVRWMDWARAEAPQPVRGRWRDNNHCDARMRIRP